MAGGRERPGGQVLRRWQPPWPRPRAWSGLRRPGGTGSGTITPPVGVVLFVTANVAKTSFERVMKATIAFLVLLLVVLLLVTLVPQVTTRLPRILLGY